MIGSLCEHPATMRLVALALLAGCSFGAPDGSPAMDDARRDDGTPTDTPTDAPSDAPTGGPTSFIIQAEAATRKLAPGTSAWIEETTPAGFGGTGVMTLNPAAVPCPTGPLVETCASLEFDVTITEERTYHLFVRMYASNGGEDSLWYAIDGVTPAVRDTNENTPMWRWESSGSSLLAPGVHVLKIWNRDGTMHLDAVALMPTSTPPP